MRRIVLLSSLTVGRCFTVAEPPDEFVEEERAQGLAAMRSIVVPEGAWKITEVLTDEVVAENAMQDTQRFPIKTKVTEIPRQGWDRLAERVAQGG